MPWPSKIYTREDLEPYTGFRKLYGECKYAREFPKEKQTLSFTDDLPTEIRLEVYKHLQLKASENFFELFSPATWYTGADNRDSIHDDVNRVIELTVNGFRYYASFRKRLSLMRLCKKVHCEIAEIFYAEQNFRFSSTNGILMLAAWMYTIKPTHFQYLRHVTVQMPMRDALGGGDRCVWTRNMWDAFESVVARRGMRRSNYRYSRRHYEESLVLGEYNYDKAVKRVLKNLKSIHGLQKLELLVPWNYPFMSNFFTEPSCAHDYMDWLDANERVRHVVEDHSFDKKYWELLAELKEQSPSEKLEIALVIHHGFRDVALDADNDWIQSRLRVARWLAAYAKVMGYEFGHTQWDDGTYRVRYDLDPLLALPQQLDEDALLLEPPAVHKETPAQRQGPKSSEEECNEFTYQLQIR